MNKLLSVQVPKSGSFTLSEDLSNMLQSGSPSAPWKGHPTTHYSFIGDVITVESKAENNKEKQIRKKYQSDLKVAHGVEGTEIMDEFYSKLINGRYDLAGSDEGSILSRIGIYLGEGMPFYIMESSEYWLESGTTEVYRITGYNSTTEISSVEISEGEAQLKSSSTKVADSKKAMNSQDEEKPEGCDCSCEKYKELMALSKKKKKDIDPSKMQQIDMSCIQKCAMEWANCNKN